MIRFLFKISWGVQSMSPKLDFCMRFGFEFQGLVQEGEAQLQAPY